MSTDDYRIILQTIYVQIDTAIHNNRTDMSICLNITEDNCNKIITILKEKNPKYYVFYNKDIILYNLDGSNKNIITLMIEWDKDLM